MIQIFLMPLIIIGQNIQGKNTEKQAKNDYLINLKAENEIRELREKIDILIEEQRKQRLMASSKQMR